MSSRRDVIKESAAFLVGGVAGAGSGSVLAAAPAFAPAPPLPWKWTQLDPMEAGTRAYRAYLKNKG